MSSKQNKKKAQQKARKQETIELEKELLKTQFPLECESLPFEDLTTEEQEVVLKCINHEKLTEEEFSRLKKVLVRYRNPMRDFEVNKTIENTKKVVQIIKSEKDFIKQFKEQNNMQLRVHLPFKYQIYEFLFDILPVTNSSVINKLDTHLNLFKDFNDREKMIYDKSNKGEQLSREEERVLKHLNKKLEEIASENETEVIDTFLENQLKIHGSDADLETRHEFWQNIPLNAKRMVFNQIQDRLGLSEYKTEELFPDSE